MKKSIGLVLGVLFFAFFAVPYHGQQDTVLGDSNTVSNTTYNTNAVYDYSHYDLNQLKSEFEKVSKEISSQEAKVKRIKSTVKSQTNTVKSLQSQIKKMQNGSYKLSQTKSIENKIKSLQGKINSIMISITNNNNDIKVINALIISLNNQKAAIKKAEATVGKIPQYNLSGVTFQITAINPNNNHKYTLFDTPMTWADAEKYCESLGGHLATVDSKNEMTLIGKLISFGKCSYYWLGANDLQVKGNYKWITGEPFNYTNWDKGEPNNHKKEQDFLRVYRNNNKWDDYNGSEKSGFICEWGIDN